MDISTTLLAGGSIFFAMNMGGSGFSSSFSVETGANLITKKQAILLFAIFVTVGAVLWGGNVVKTLGSGIIPSGTFNNIKIVITVILASSISLFIANLLKVPESTSWVTVFSISTVGIFFSNLNFKIFLYKIIPSWIILPVVGYFITFLILKIFYPLSEKNFRIFELLTKYERKTRIFVIASSCCVAMALGSNNVANVIGPLSGAGIISPRSGLALLSPVFGAGAIVFHSPSITVGKEIVPLGLFTAAIIKFIFGSLLLIASLLGIPQSCVQLNVACVVAVFATKEGTRNIVKKWSIKKILLLWFVSPCIASFLTYFMLWLLI